MPGKEVNRQFIKVRKYNIFAVWGKIYLYFLQVDIMTNNGRPPHKELHAREPKQILRELCTIHLKDVI
jgi:hypothetical protein